jgi:transcription elongation factor Elf1
MPWNTDDPMERRKRIAWSVATSSCIETGKDPVDVYNKLMDDWDEVDKNSHLTLDESHKT